jgi:hypothetical protein
MSDGLTDVARSNRISGAFNALLKSEMIFLTNPNQENLDSVYNKCSELRGLRGGYWGESGEPTARRVEDHYRERFGDQYKGTSIANEDIAVLLTGLKDEYKIESLAGLMTMKDGLKIDDKGYWSTLNNNIEKLRSTLTLEQMAKLSEDPVEPIIVYGIFSKIGYKI